MKTFAKKLRAVALTLGVVLITALTPAVAPLLQARAAIEIMLVHIFGGAQDSRSQVIQGIADEFMAQHPDIKITLNSTSTDYTELFNQALLAAEQGNGPHIVQVEEGLTQLAADLGSFAAISDLATPEQLASLDDVLPTLRNYYKIGDVTWSVPWNSSNPLLYYNKDMFKAAGLDPDKPPTTFAEIMTDCEAIMKMQADLKLQACINFPMVSWFAEQWVAMQNGLIANNDNGRSTRATEMLFTSPEMLTVANFYKDMTAKKYYIYSGRANDYTGEGITFLSKQTAMTLNSTAGLTLFTNFSKAQKFELGVGGLPAPSNKADNGGTVGGASLWVVKDHPAEELKAATDFIFFLTSQANDIKWHQGSGYFPSRISSIKQLTEEGWFKEHPAFEIAVKQLEASKGTLANAGAVVGPSTDVREALIKAFQSIVDSGEDPAKALEAAKAIADKALTDYNEVVK